jgi:hypothetical protein
MRASATQQGAAGYRPSPRPPRAVDRNAVVSGLPGGLVVVTSRALRVLIGDERRIGEAVVLPRLVRFLGAPQMHQALRVMQRAMPEPHVFVGTVADFKEDPTP